LVFPFLKDEKRVDIAETELEFWDRQEYKFVEKWIGFCGFLFDAWNCFDGICWIEY